MRGFAIFLCFILLLLSMTGCQSMASSKDTIKVLKEEEIKNIKEFETEDISLSEEKRTLYKSYAETGDEELLLGLNPMDVFRFYCYAYEIQDYQTLYGLYIKGEKYGTPSWKDFLEEVIKEKGGTKNQMLITALKENTLSLAQILYDNNTSYIQINLKEGNEISKEEVLHFRLVKNENNIWKVDWLPFNN